VRLTRKSPSLSPLFTTTRLYYCTIIHSASCSSLAYVMVCSRSDNQNVLSDSIQSYSCAHEICESILVCNIQCRFRSRPLFLPLPYLWPPSTPVVVTSSLVDVIALARIRHPRLLPPIYLLKARIAKASTSNHNDMQSRINLAASCFRPRTFLAPRIFFASTTSNGTDPPSIRPTVSPDEMAICARDSDRCPGQGP